MDIYQLRGCGTALVTPFETDGRLDEAALRRLVRRQLEAGIDFLVPCGTTGESPVLSSKEHFRVVEIVLEEAKGKVPVMAGAGGNNTDRVREGIQELERMGVDAILSVTPYYNKPTQEGLYQHYRALAESTRLPILLYNVPGRTGSNIEPKTHARLATIPSILGVKEASGNLAQVDEILRLLPERFRVISGDDALTLPMLSLGAAGVISVVSNVAPREMTELVARANAGDFASARRIHRRLLPLMQVLFVESNPIPVKAALAEMGLIHLAYRLPLVPPQPENHARIRRVLDELGLMPAKEKAYAVGGAN
ncbi:MAG TPA: 4-hydroxy-tetrahydrodipicolinate synthase [Terriglobia bacterium]|jgi:4-hydroxy-tetrahydrodipicolinate synthase